MDDLTRFIEEIAGAEATRPEQAAPAGSHNELSPGQGVAPGEPGAKKPWGLKDVSQLGLAEVVGPAIADEVKFLPASGEFRLWHGEEGRWKTCDLGAVLPHVGAVLRKVIKAHPGEFNHKGEWTESPEAKFARGQLSRRGLSDVLSLATAQPVMHAAIEDFDTQPHLLLCANAVVDLATGQLASPTPDMKLSARCPVAYRTDRTPKEMAPRFHLFLEEVFAGQNQAQTIDYMQKALGYAITGHMREHKFFVLYGREGRNGKTTLLTAIRETLGPEVAAPASAGTFLTTSDGKAIRSDLAKLAGKRFVATDEAPPNAELSTVLKSVTGGGMITAKFEYGRPFDYAPTYKVFIDCNYRPGIKAGDTAMVKRLVSIGFRNDFTKTADTGLRETLAGEKEGILAWLVAGAVRYEKERLTTPDHLQEAIEAHRDEDPQEQFLADRCSKVKGGHVGSNQLHMAYKSFMSDQGYDIREVKGKDAFLKDLPFEKGKVGGVRSVKGIVLNSSPVSIGLFKDKSAAAPAPATAPAGYTDKEATPPDYTELF